MAIDGFSPTHCAESAVVLVNGVPGGEMVLIRDALVHSLNTPVVLLEPGAGTVSVDPLDGVLEVDGRRVRPVVVWARHASAAAVAARGGHTVLDAVSWAGLLTFLTASAHTALPGSAPAGPGQLADAGRLGVRVPRTVVTTDPAAAARRIGAARTVVKTQDFRLYETDRRRWDDCLPRLTTGADNAADDLPGGRPVIVQEYVVHDRELRVYYLDGGVCAFEIGKPGPSSMWTDPGGVTVTRVDCPPGAARAVRVLCIAWRLRFGAFDLLVAPGGELVFLEVNPDGDWLWFERKARWHGVSFMAAVMVRELFIRGTGSSRR